MAKHTSDNWVNREDPNEVRYQIDLGKIHSRCHPKHSTTYIFGPTEFHALLKLNDDVANTYLTYYAESLTSIGEK
jgi:hypothetical protein